MSVADIKSKIIQQMDSFDENRLEELYGFFQNHINSQNDIDDWSILTTEQQNGIGQAIDEINQGKGIPHDLVMSNIRQRFLSE